MELKFAVRIEFLKGLLTQSRQLVVVESQLLQARDPIEEIIRDRRNAVHPVCCGGVFKFLNGSSK